MFLLIHRISIMIPKIIHYCWLSNDPIPEELQRYMQTWKEKLPDYEFMLWNFERFDINSSIWVKQAFEAKKYAFACDYIRLYAVYNYGGIYMDMDVEVIKPFDDLLKGDYILGKESEESVEAGIFGAVPKANWIKKCLEYYENKHFTLDNTTYDETPLPYTMYNILSKEIEHGHLKLLPTDYLTAKSWKNGKIHVTSNTYTIHHFAASWISNKQKAFEKIARIAGPQITHLLGKTRRFINKCFSTNI